ncbi:unnamed protein product [Kuraishia capsulata CBS 1993]|uniref:peptide-methionine (S)-S-oxide reductase n=1 Tax=Kuraishia capsulata CBS 1993 TaxID=1382522 RepID=W6MFD0_9ASCO|nr:uncharacterized protein KUCA_T00000442001 [Kuraishia capsulata CBS 1993]CDK24479.1 unnamed protein product [Kuraishia capsulata CBS 1993]
MHSPISLKKLSQVFNLKSEKSMRSHQETSDDALLGSVTQNVYLPDNSTDNMRRSGMDYVEPIISPDTTMAPNDEMAIMENQQPYSSQMSAMSSTISKTIKHGSADKFVGLAAGCFWGTEHIYRRKFGDKITDYKVGYANGVTANPDYKAVCNGDTNHAETLQISYDPAKVSFKELIEFFFVIHDPTTLNSQGPDVGTQYRSAIFTHSESDLNEAREIRDAMQSKWYPKHKIVTQIEPIESFWDAEEYHQLYLDKNPNGYHCPSHFIRTTPKE